MSEKVKQYFGTDGIRGRVGEEPITPGFMLKLGWAIGTVLGNKKGLRNRRVVIGKDTRISGYMFESALEAGLAAAGMSVKLLGPMPTPGVAYLTRTLRAQAGIVISASHNPHMDNGVKFFSSAGLKLDDDLELKIEAALDSDIKICEPERLGKARRIEDAAGRYIEFCKSTFDKELNLNGLHLVLDCAHGATYQVGPKVFEELGAEVTAIGVTPNGLNINQDVGSTSIGQLQKRVLKEGAHLGIAFDGDGDRVMMVDAAGNILDGDELLYVIAMSRKKLGTLHGGVVGTQMSNFGLALAFERENIPFVRSKVGDRYVMEMLIEKDWKIGGESSGHIICLDQTTTGDGLVSALQVLRAIVREGKSIAELLEGMQKAPQKMINVRLTKPGNPTEHPEIIEAVQLAERKLENKGRVLLRMSGTEPLTRVMVEGEDLDLVVELAGYIAEVVEEVT